MAFGGKVDDGVDVVPLEDFFYPGAVGNVGVLEKITAAAELFFDVGKACRVARVGERVKIDDAALEVGRLLQEHMDKVATDEAGAAGDENVGKFAHD